MSAYVVGAETIAKRIHFRHRRRAPCFWCGGLITPRETTMDHIVSVRRGGTGEPDNLVISCQPCNDERNVFQVLATTISYLGTRANVNMGKRSAKFVGGWKEWLECRENILDLMLKWEQLYHDRLEGMQLSLCLAEIDEVLEVRWDAAARHQENAARSVDAMVSHSTNRLARLSV